MIPVVAAALIDVSGRVLLQQRAPGRSHAGLWEFPGGKVEAGESLETALVREIAEELALAIEPESLEPVSFASAPGNRHVVLLYSCRRWDGEPSCLDAASIGWFEPSMLSRLPLLPLDVPLAAALTRQLQGAK